VSLRAVVDARELFGKPTGVGRYLRELLTRWAAAPYAAGAECVLVGHRDPGEAAPLPAGPGATMTWHHAPGSGGTGWEQGALATAVNRTHADVLFAPAYSMPLRTRIPAVLAMHDVSFAAHPGWFTLREGVRRRLLSRWSAHKATAILTLTRFSAGEIVTRLGVRGGRIHVIPLAVDYAHPLWPTSHPEALVDRTGVLFVGSIFERRHVPLLLEGVALAGAQVTDLTLDVIGENRTRPFVDLEARARSLGLGDVARFRGYVSDAELAEAYGRNAIFAFLSEYEGFGLPPLEAMQAGLATVVLDTPVAREVYGDGALYVPPGDAPALARLLARLATDPAFRRACVARGRVVAASYRWDDTAVRTWRVLETTARGPR
jgi:glycosyltransferase involved in cell wall biosynthesis